MNFQNLSKMKEEKPRLYEQCIQAESLARIDPVGSAFHARKAIEVFFEEKIRDNQIYAGNLSIMIERVSNDVLNADSKFKRDAHSVRSTGNVAVHADKIDKINIRNIKRAINNVEKLYNMMCNLFDCNKVFELDQVPFGDYEIVRKIPKYYGELLCDDYNYFVKVIDENTKSEQYHYLQCLSVNSNLALNNRREEAVKRIINIKKRENYLLKPYVVHKFHSETDRKIIVYNVSEDSWLLSENKYKMSLGQALKVGLDLVYALKDLKNQNLHHRNICPGCIIVDTVDQSFDAYLINMQTAKIQNYKETVCALLSNIWETNPFVPKFLLGNDNFNPDSFLNWGKIDVFSVGKIILYCMDPNMATVECTDDIYDYCELPDGLLDLYDRLFQEDIDFTEIPDLDEMEKILVNEIEKL